MLLSLFLPVRVEEVEHAFQVWRDNPAVSSSRHFHVLMVDAEPFQFGDHGPGTFDRSSRVGVVMHNELPQCASPVAPTPE